MLITRYLISCGRIDDAVVALASGCHKIAVHHGEVGDTAVREQLDDAVRAALVAK
jgi:hypothetical protein